MEPTITTMQFSLDPTDLEDQETFLVFVIDLENAVTRPTIAHAPYIHRGWDSPNLRRYFKLERFEALPAAANLEEPAGVVFTILVIGNIPSKVGATRINASLMRSVMKFLDVPFYALKEDCRRSGRTRALFRMKVCVTEVDAILRTFSNRVLFHPDFLLVLHPNGRRDQLLAAVDRLRQKGFMRHGLMTIERQR
jgi:hypothetical protein